MRMRSRVTLLIQRGLPFIMARQGMVARSCSEWKRLKDCKFIDWKKVRFRAGRGGNGFVSFRKDQQLGGPDGGNGGTGGSVKLVADASEKTLAGLRTAYRGVPGEDGWRAYHTGKNGGDLAIKVPIGTVVKEGGAVLADLMEAGQSFTVVRGGEGGDGNAAFASPYCRRPKEFTAGEEGEERLLEVEMRVIADVGMVGFPNAGKSTLLRAISCAKPKVAAYPFTTLNPYIGAVHAASGEPSIAVADIPGLIPGAHQNKGLGFSFLRHLQRCRLLLFVLDASGPDPHTQLSQLQYELRQYSPSLCSRAGLIVANKMDVSRAASESVQVIRKHTPLPIIPVSALHHWNISSLISALHTLIGSESSKGS